MMNTVEAMPFSENALRRIAQIIIKKYRNQQDEDDDITSTASLYDALFPGRRNTRNFFARAGCLKDFIDTDEVLNSTFLSLAKVQTYPDGKAKLIRIIEQLCDPEEYFDNPESREVVIKQINEVLSRYYLKVAMSGKVYKRVTSPLQVGLDNATSDLNTIQRETRDNSSSLQVDKGKYSAYEQQKVFVCYSHKDDKWLKYIQDYLKPLERENIIDLWDDTKIAVGAKWKEEIAKAIQSSTVAVTLVSASFLASDFISEYELPTLLSRAKNEGTTIIPIIVGHCLFSGSDLNVFQAINPPNRPLSAMKRPEWEKTLTSLAETIKQWLDAGKP